MVGEGPSAYGYYRHSKRQTDCQTLSFGAIQSIIDSQQKEIEKLRKSLKEIAALNVGVGTFKTSSRLNKACRIARSAIGE